MVRICRESRRMISATSRFQAASLLASSASRRLLIVLWAVHLRKEWLARKVQLQVVSKGSDSAGPWLAVELPHRRHGKA